jgi:hypothetical protein
MDPYGINPAFTNDKSVDYPPPPPSDPPPSSDGYQYTDEERYLDELVFKQQSGNNDEFEHTLSEAGFHTGPFDEEYDSDDETPSEILVEKKRPGPKKLLLVLASVLFIIVAALGAVTAQRNKASREQATVVAASTSALISNTEKPTRSPTKAPTKAPTASKAPTKPPSKSPSQHPFPDHPVTTCKNEISLSKECYTHGESIEITFTTCKPAAGDWFGFYRPNAVGESGNMRGRASYWELPCGGHGESCETLLESGTLTIDVVLPLGPHQIHSIESGGRPYHSKSSSEVFFVRKFCRSESDASYHFDNKHGGESKREDYDGNKNHGNAKYNSNNNKRPSYGHEGSSHTKYGNNRRPDNPKYNGNSKNLQHEDEDEDKEKVTPQIKFGNNGRKGYFGNNNNH